MDVYARLQYLPVVIPVLILAAMLHELAHAAVATALGDPTSRRDGRLTLNPIRHLDPFGSALFLLTYLFTSFAFGWARPVLVNRNNFRHPRRDMAVVAIAGPLVNFLLGLGVYAYVTRGGAVDSDYAREVLTTALQINVVLSVFNMLPVPPLDGSRIVGLFMSDDLYEKWSNLDQYAFVFFLLIFLVLQEQFTILISAGMDWTLWLYGLLV